jgi:hypothetical protein
MNKLRPENQWEISGIGGIHRWDGETVAKPQRKARKIWSCFALFQPFRRDAPLSHIKKPLNGGALQENKTDARRGERIKRF